MVGVTQLCIFLSIYIYVNLFYFHLSFETKTYFLPKMLNFALSLTYAIFRLMRKQPSEPINRVIRGLTVYNNKIIIKIYL